MQRTIYIDSIFLSNLIMDLLLLFLTTRTLKKSTTFLKTLAGSLLGAAGYCLILCLPGRYPIKVLFGLLPVTALMIKAGCGTKGLKELLYGMGYLFTYAFLLGGFMLSLIKNIPFFYFEDISSKYMTQLVEKIVEMFQLRSSFHMKVCFSIIDMFLNTHFDLMRCIDSQEILENYRMVIKAKEEMNETKMKIAKEINLSKDRIHHDKLNYVFSFN